MNSDNRVYELSLEMIKIYISNSWRITAVFLDDTQVSGQVLGHNTIANPYTSTVTIKTDDNEDITINLRNVKRFTA